MRPEQRVKSAITRVAFTGAAAGTVIAAFGPWNWIAGLFSHFRLYYLMTLGLLALTFLHRQRWALLAVTVGLAVPNAWYVVPYLLPAVSAPVAAEGPAVIKVTSMNLNYRNRDHARARAYLVSTMPDIIVLEEYTPDWHAALGTVASRYPYRVTQPQPGPFGMAILSRLPLYDVRQIDLGVTGVVNLAARLELGGRDLSLYAVHLHPPITRQRAAFRNRQLQRLGDAVARGEGHRIVIGDLNLTPFSPRFGELLAASGVADARKPQGIHITWPTMPLPLWIPIDHCLADPGAGVIDVRNGPAFGSDHYPLEVTLMRGYGDS